MATGYFSHPDCFAHVMGEEHPESPARLHAIQAELQAQALWPELKIMDVPLATNDQLALAHDEDYVQSLDDFLQQLESTGETRVLEQDTWACPGTRSAAWRAAGAALAATDAVLKGEVSNAFCAIRPPGHHATRNQTMGFCFFNNVALAVKHALEVHGLKRVAIVDFDVHHGNGTEDIFSGDDRVLMVSFFQHPLFPFSGAESRAGNMVNVPVPARSNGMVIRDVIESYWMYRLEDFEPEMIFISAGFDAHAEDVMSDVMLQDADYAWITSRVVAIAKRYAQGRIVSCLEGGYHLPSLSRSVAVHLKTMMEA